MNHSKRESQFGLRRRRVNGPLHQKEIQSALNSSYSRPERKRVKSWSSEGELHRVLHCALQEYDYDTDLEDHEDGQEEDNENIFFLLPATVKAPESQPASSASALALRHGATLTKESPQPRLTSQRPAAEASSAPTIRKQHNSHQVRDNNPWLIPVNHPLKMLWDVATVVLSIINAYMTHRAIRDRQFHSRPGLIEAWFLLDIFLNFVTQRTTPDGTVLTTFTAVWARYLTSWFVIDILALFPGEVLYIQPVIELQKRRNFWQKLFRRTKVSLKVTTRILQSGHVPWLYKVVVKARPIRECWKLIRLLIKYIPKYLLFVRNMKGVLVIRALRDFKHFRALQRAAHTVVKEDATVDTTLEDEEPEDWEKLQDDIHIDKDDEDVPF